MPQEDCDETVPKRPHEGKLLTLEMARGLAACAVVLFHANAAAKHFAGPHIPFLSFFEHGVDFFFVLSGFIIYHVHRDEIGQPKAAREYGLKRLIRLFPLLWTVVLTVALVRVLFQHEDLTGHQLINSLLLYPSLQVPIPQVVWTLRHEMLFYTLFLVLMLHRRIGVTLFALWTIAAVVQLGLSILGRPVTGLASFFMSPFQLDFAFGALVAHAHRSGRFGASKLPLLLALAALVAALILEERFSLRRTDLADYVSIPATLWTVVLGAIFALLLQGLLCLEQRLRVPQPLVLLGAASYAIYLFHTPVNAIAQRIAALFPAQALAMGAGHIFVSGAGIAVGILVHLHYEKPIGRALGRVLLPGRASRPPQPASAPSSAVKSA